MKRSILFLLFVFPIIAFSQNKDSIQTKFFSNMYSEFYLAKSNQNQISGFKMPTALFGYSVNLNNKVKGIIIYDVTRTTNSISVYDSNSNMLQVSYFEGSKYTAFLKMAEIKWLINSKLSVSTGQLLNTQYLTYQDKYWQHRYVDVTFQEKYRFGMPADFGFRIEYSPLKMLTINTGVYNGEGPFRYQDPNSDFLVDLDILLKFKNLSLKSYLGQHYSKFDSLPNSKILSLFIGYDYNAFRFATEFDYIANANFTNNNWEGISIYGMYDFNKHWEIFYRFDYIVKSANYQSTAYHIAGIEYSPLKNLKISANYRYMTKENTSMFMLNFGLKM